MNITILNVEVATKPTKTGRTYQEANVAYKNNSFGGKVEGKKLMSFGAQADAFKVLVEAQAGQTFEVEFQKNAAGYNDWVKIERSTEFAAPNKPQPNVAQGAVLGAPQSSSTRPTYETPEDRAQKQVYIIRQSSVSTAATILAVGSKSPIKTESVIQEAKKIEDYVLGKVSPGPSGVEDFPAFEPDSEFPEVQ